MPLDRLCFLVFFAVMIYKIITVYRKPLNPEWLSQKDNNPVPQDTEKETTC